MAHSVYSIFDRVGRLLYVGYTSRPIPRRVTEHARTKVWFAQAATVKWDCFARRGEALAMERWAIIRGRPLHNVRHVSPVARKMAYYRDLYAQRAARRSSSEEGG